MLVVLVLFVDYVSMLSMTHCMWYRITGYEREDMRLDVTTAAVNFNGIIVFCAVMSRGLVHRYQHFGAKPAASILTIENECSRFLVSQSIRRHMTRLRCLS